MADELDINVANTRRQWDTSSESSIMLDSDMTLFVRPLLLSCFSFGNVARQGTYESPSRKEKQPVGMATRIIHH